MNKDVLAAKLGRRFPDGTAETAEQIIDRVSRILAEVERHYGATSRSAEMWERAFCGLMVSNRFWPSGRILNGAGSRRSQLGSCFVIPVRDDLASIYKAIALAARCHSMGGGTGFDLSPLREAGASISSAEAAGATGPVSWLPIIDASTDAIMRGGKMRGANLASLRVDHPDILEFISAKEKVGQLPNFNLSVAITDSFMRALIESEYVPLISPLGGQRVREVAAAEIWHAICVHSWRTGDPGILWIDAINRSNPLLPTLGPILTTNPCGEQTLYPLEASNLGSVNLDAFVDRGSRSFDWSSFEETVGVAVRCLDNAVDASQYPHPDIKRMVIRNRRLGLGVMGFADLLIHLGIPYDSERAVAIVDEIGQRFRDVAWQASRELADERGPYPGWSQLEHPQRVRNCAVTSIAPTGTISMIAECSGGIEPRFAPYWNKDVLRDGGLDYFDEDLVCELETVSCINRRDAIDLLRKKPVAELPLPRENLARFRFAHDISAATHVAVAAAWQKYIDNAISKTINLPRDCSVEEISEALVSAWEKGCKGISIYRQDSRKRDLLCHSSITRLREDPDQFRQSKSLVAATGPHRAAP